jgi:hypothetical protein
MYSIRTQYYLVAVPNEARKELFLDKSTLLRKWAFKAPKLATPLLTTKVPNDYLAPAENHVDFIYLCFERKYLLNSLELEETKIDMDVLIEMVYKGQVEFKTAIPSSLILGE